MFRWSLYYSHILSRAKGHCKGYQSHGSCSDFVWDSVTMRIFRIIKPKNSEFISRIKKWDTFCLPQYTKCVWDFMESLGKVVLKLHLKKKERLEAAERIWRIVTYYGPQNRVWWKGDSIWCKESLMNISPRTVLWPEGNTNQIRTGFCYWVGKYVCKLDWVKKVLHGKSQVRRAVDPLYKCSHKNIMIKTLAQTLMRREGQLFRMWIPL